MNKLTKITNLNLYVILFILLVSWFIFPPWSLNIICLACCNGLVVLSLLVLMRCGLISFGHGLYYCLGGYTVAISYNFLNILYKYIINIFNLTLDMYNVI